MESTNYLFVKGLELINFTSKRASIQVYTILNGKLYFLLGICSAFENSNLENLGDFGGTHKKNENSATTAIREFNEETNLLFGKLTITQFSEYFSVIRRGPIRSRNRKPGPNAPNEAIKALNRIQSRPSLYPNKDIDSEMTITFMYVENKWLENAPKLFNVNKLSGDEINNVCWVFEEEFVDLIKNKCVHSDDIMWNKLRRFYNPVYLKIIKSLKDESL